MHSYLCLIFHTHLPFVRNVAAPVLEENWLFEAIHESYLPLLQMLDRWQNENIRGKITFSLTPTLCAMLQDDLLQSRISARIKKARELSEKEITRHKNHPQLLTLAEHYQQHFANIDDYYHRVIQRDLIARFRHHAHQERIEIIASCATHAVLPLLADVSSMMRQINIGIQAHQHYLAKTPTGFWLPECAYTPQCGKFLHNAGIKYTMVGSHAFLYATPRPPCGVYAPTKTPEGIIVLARDHECSAQVWNAKTGYPSNGQYREFYRDLGWDGDDDYLRDYFAVEKTRHDLGFKYHRVTGEVDLAHKDFYSPKNAQAQVKIHAQDFVDQRYAQSSRLREQLNFTPIITAPYDTELFGHWWYEGVDFIDHVVRLSENSALKIVTPNEVLNEASATITPAVSTWGGYFYTWLNGENDWLYPQLFSAQKIYQDVEQTPTVNEWQTRLRQQMLCELLLAQASDWSFILTTRTVPNYARQQITTHLQNFHQLHQLFIGDATNATISEPFIKQLSSENNAFTFLLS